MQKGLELTKKQIIEIVVVVFVMGMAILVFDYINANYRFDGKIERNSAGEGALSEELVLEFLDNKQEMTVEVSDRRLSKKELKEAFDQAVSEINDTYLGQNDSAENVCYDLDLRSSYVDGLINAQWKFDQYGIVSSEGKLQQEEIPEEGIVVNMTAVLSYEEEESLYSFSVVVNQKGLDTLDGQLDAISREIKAKDQSSRTKSKFKLPDEVASMNLIWKKKMNYRGLQLIILGLLAVAGIQIGRKQDDKKVAAALAKEKEQDYPIIMSQLSILMGAGMSFRKALERITAKYVLSLKNGAPQRAGFDEMLKTYRKMADGRSEIQALEELGKSCESKEYRKLSMMLIQNLRKGSKDLLDSLEKEEKYAFEMRKQRAIRAGEEASTKLLVPMAGMLFIVIVILVVPAIMQMNL
ncbi:MAG: type II secretion system F family protein [Pseudobutyrivibrio sp.]|nr:type II secretion system F family protein [Pseudobutyrivibrio sp.]